MAVFSDPHTVAVCKPGSDLRHCAGLGCEGRDHRVGKIVTMRGVGQLYVTTRLQWVGEGGREEQMVLEYGLNIEEYFRKAVAPNLNPP
jgi:hypothetical protein